MPKMTVVMPVYNMEAYLGECLDSVLSQSLEDIEVIAVNDGSKDGSLAILRDYEKKDARLIVIDKENGGAGAARNAALDRATGEFVAFLDADDFYPGKDTLEKLYTAATEHQVKVSGGYCERCFEDGHRERMEVAFENLSFPTSGKISYRDFQYDYCYQMCCFERKLLEENHIRFPLYRRFQDPPFFVNTMILAKELYLFDEPTYCYRVLPSEEKYTIQRSKGLGENEPEMMSLTTMNPATRRLIKVMPDSAEQTAAIFDTLLGDDLQGRKDFIVDHGADYIDQLDVS